MVDVAVSCKAEAVRCREKRKRAAFTLCVWDLRGGRGWRRETGTRHGSSVLALLVSPDGCHVADRGCARGPCGWWISWSHIPRALAQCQLVALWARLPVAYTMGTAGLAGTQLDLRRQLGGGDLIPKVVFT